MQKPRIRWHIAVFLAPAVLIYTSVMIFPLFNTLRLALFQKVDQERVYVGLEHFRTLFFDPTWSEQFWNALANNFWFFLIHMLVQNPIGIALAALLSHPRLRFAALYRSAIFIPTILSFVIVGFAWKLILSPIWGIAPSMLDAVGLKSLFAPWLGKEEYALTALSLVSVWQFVGIPMMLIYAALLSIPVEILGLNGTPDAGDEFVVSDSERSAREVAEMRSMRTKESAHAQQQAAKLDALFQGMGSEDKKVLNVVLKTDVRGSLEALTASLQKLGNEEVKVNVIASGVGAISESDANLAITSQAVVFGFNVRATGKARTVIEQAGLDLRYYNVIYNLIDDVKAALNGLLSPDLREEIVGLAEVRDVFNSPKFGQVAGCMVIEGSMYRSKRIRVLRDEVVIYEGELESLRRFKEAVADVRQGMECGIGVKNYNDVKVGDQIEVFDTVEVQRTL